MRSILVRSLAAVLIFSAFPARAAEKNLNLYPVRDSSQMLLAQAMDGAPPSTTPAKEAGMTSKEKWLIGGAVGVVVIAIIIAVASSSGGDSGGSGGY